MCDDGQSKKDIPSGSASSVDDDQLKNDIPSDLDLQPPVAPALPQVVKPNQLHSTSIERDHGLRIQIHEYPVNQMDKLRRAYINLGPYQPKLSNYPNSSDGKQNRQFKYEWFKQFPWLEYSPSKDKVYCFPCFLFENTVASRSSLVVGGFSGWKRVND
ncbi:uncharacterized protein LOC132296493 [Cornus florida]|uniref:uncharacterized protein LOC132296493 n=1 Tax=Cornus florida TaxID=4283 RepID=UPI0028973431|nr:uncharacterized protein LOC132296493 [Cornus florida]